MSNPESFSHENQEISRIEKCVYLADTQEEAVQLVKDFWNTVAPNSQFSSFKKDEDYMGELTMGNNQALSRTAVEWLKEKGVL